MSMNESEALRHVEAAERAVATIDGLLPGTPTVPIRSAGVVGFGTMGSGIAMAFANAGLPVRVLDETREAVDRGLASIRRTYRGSMEKGRLTPEEVEARLGRIEPTLDYADLGGSDVVVEAVFEELEAKQRVFARLDAICREDAILATNTSSLDVARIARGTRRPERVVGMHFFSPAHVMRLVEVVRPEGVAPSTLATTVELARRLGKIGVVVGVCDGFVGNRMLYAYRRQTDFLLEDGALPAQVDRALTEFGLPMGPYQMADLAGLDISWRIRKRQAATRRSDLRYSPIADRLCERGRFGQKTGAGWYRYEPGSRTPLPDPEVEETIRAVSAEKGIARRDIRDEEIVERALFALVNEGAHILEEGLAARASDIDVIWIHGYGFPRARGGPMFWADGVGLGRVAEVVQTLHAEQGDLVRPSAKLLALAREDGRFSQGPGPGSPE
jgi:3-hydroxyacyl-CoA dehydrogenase